jgi:hypothetical protein
VIDRVLVGAVVSNTSSNDHSTSLANLDNTADKLSTTILSLARRRAQEADPYIRPIKVSEDEEWYVCFAPTRAFRDLEQSTAMQTANRDGWARGKDNPIFRSGDLIWNGIIVREVPEIGYITGAGASGIDVAACYFCGAQAIGLAWGERPHFEYDEFDYKNKRGVAVSEIRGVEKLMFNNVQHGMLTLYVAAVADS